VACHVAEDDATEEDFEYRESYEVGESLCCRLERTRKIHGGNISRNDQLQLVVAGRLTGQQALTDAPLQ
jgi:hypothetical protein